uniref:Si:ch73-21g5.7 n=1 Tax=Hippocampus comes TaxID=109280 RepID=A0A3Q2Y908_HIPCM
CKVMLMERKCTDKAARMHSALQRQLSAGVSGSGSDAWDKTVSFFAVKKALIFHNGYTKLSREALRAFPSPADDVNPLC